VDIPFRKLNETLKAKGSNRTREIPSSILGGGIFLLRRKMEIKLPENPNIYFILLGVLTIFSSFILVASTSEIKIRFIIIMVFGVLFFFWGTIGLQNSQNLKDKNQELINKKIEEEINEIRTKTKWIELEPNSRWSSKSMRGLGAR